MRWRGKPEIIWEHMMLSERRIWTGLNSGAREGAAHDQKAAQDTRGKLTLLHSLPSSLVWRRGVK